MMRSFPLLLCGLLLASFTVELLPPGSLVPLCRADSAASDAVTLSLPLLPEASAVAPAQAPATLEVGGADERRVVLRPNVPLIQRVLLRPGDLQAARLRLRVLGKPQDLPTVRLVLYRILRPFEGAPQPGKDYAAEPLASLALKDVTGDGAIAADCAQAVRQWAAGDWPDHGLLLSLVSSGSAKPRLQLSSPAAKERPPVLELVLRSYAPAKLFPAALTPRPGVYATVQNGHIYYGDQRLRLWGANRHSARESTAVRIREMGFNAVRLWGPRGYYTEASARQGKPIESRPGDGTDIDDFDRFAAAAKREGLFLMLPALMYDACGADKQPVPGFLADDSFVAGGEDWADWKAAFTAAKKVPGLTPFLVYFDERMQKIRWQHTLNFLNHVNPYTGRRYAEEEAVVLWEVFNENGFPRWVLEQGMEKWPAYFQDKLKKRWNDWLANRYKSQQELKTAWGTLDASESLSAGNVALLPLFAQRNKYPQQRGRDVVRFIVETVGRFNQDYVERCRAQAPAGVGINVVPFLHDTQFRNSAPWQYVNAQADVMSFGTYEWTLTSALTAPPRGYILDANTIADKPNVVYEVNTSRPNPYRAEFPLRLAALASWQDWDGIFWHYWDEPAAPRGQDIPAERYLVEPMHYMSKGWADGGFMHATDPVMCSALAIASEIFRGHAIAPAASPLVYKVGPKAVFGYDYFNGIPQTRTVFERGSRIRFDLKDPTLEVSPAPVAQRSTGPVASGTQLLWDWPNGRLIIDTPTTKAYIGRISGGHRFRDGISLTDVSTRFVTFALVSADGRPLTGADASKTIHVTALADARNTGLDIDLSGALPDGGFLSPDAQAAMIRSKGRAPTVVDKVAYSLSFPTRMNYRFEGYDFALRPCLRIEQRDSHQLKHDGRELFMGVLHVETRGEAVQAIELPAPSTQPSAALPTAASRPVGSAASVDRANLWNPIAGLTWDVAYPTAHQLLRDSSIAFSRITPMDRSEKAEKTIVLSDTTLFWKAPADVEVGFRDGRMSRISVTFAQPPSFSEAVADYEKQLGSPAEKKIASVAYETSLVRWRVQRGTAALQVVLTEHQGTMGMSCELVD